MVLVADIGNTNITLGIYKNDELIFVSRLATQRHRTSEQYAIELNAVFNLENISGSFEGAVISSVVPELTRAFKEAIKKVAKVEPLVVAAGIKNGLKIATDNPKEVGADLVAGAVGAIAEYTLPCIVIDMGTATTVSVIDSEGQFLGGSIAAGVMLTLKALSENTSQLPSINISAPPSVIGRNTVDCMRSGLILGTASMIDGLIERISEELDEIPTVVATGGLSKEIITHCKSDIIYNENLLLDGLREIYEKNK